MKNEVRNAVDAYTLNPCFEGRSVTSLAKRLGVSRATVYYWIRRNNVPEQHLDAFAAVTGCSPAAVNAVARRGYEIAKTERG